MTEPDREVVDDSVYVDFGMLVFNPLLIEERDPLSLEQQFLPPRGERVSFGPFFFNVMTSAINPRVVMQWWAQEPPAATRLQNEGEGAIRAKGGGISVINMSGGALGMAPLTIPEEQVKVRVLVDSPGPGESFVVQLWPS